MERKIGEIFEYDGEWYQCVEQCVEHEGCHGCAFDISYGIRCSFNGVPHCSAYRSDGKPVIFKKLEKVGESPCKSCYFGMVQLYKLPYWNNGMVEPVGCHFTGDGCVLIEIKQTKEDMGDNADIRPYDELFSPGTVSNTKHLAKENMEENKLNLKPFDIQKAREGKPVCTRDGRRARIVCFDKREGFPIVALVETKVNSRISEEVALFDIDGRAVTSDIDSKLDLMMLPEKKEGWINVYDADTTFRFVEGMVYNTKDEAIQRAKEEVTNGQREKNEYVDTVKICWEE